MSIPDFYRDICGFNLSIPEMATLSQLLKYPDYILAGHYAALNISMTLVALLWGVAMMATLLRFVDPDKKKFIPFSASIFLSISTGFAFIIAELFLLALTHFLDKNGVLFAFALTSISALVLIFTNRQLVAKAIVIKTNLIETLTTILFCFALLLVLFATASSPSLGDSTGYHAPYAKFFLEHHGLAVNEHLTYPYHTFNFNLLYSLGLMLEDSISYLQSIHALFVVLTMLGIYVFCRQTKAPLFLSILAPFGYLQLYSVKYGLETANVDLGGTFFVFAGVFALWFWCQTRSIFFLVLSAISIGIAMGIKYILMLLPIPAMICIVICEKRNSWRSLLIYLLWIAAWGSWWYLRNFIEVGNPVEPFAASIFGYHLWTPEDLASLYSNKNNFIPLTLPGFLLSPYYAHQSEVLSLQGGLVVIGIIYLSTLLCWAAGKSINILLVFIWLWFIWWIFGSQDPRHLLPIVPLALVHAAVIPGDIMDYFSRRWASSLARKLRFAFTVLVLVVAFWYIKFSIQYLLARLYYSNLFPDTAQEKMLRGNPVYDLYSHANEFFSKTDTIFEFVERDGRWFFHGDVIGSYFGQQSYVRILDEASVSKEPNVIVPAVPKLLEQTLKHRYGTSGFIITRSMSPLYYSEKDFDAYFKLLYRNAEGSIYTWR